MNILKIIGWIGVGIAAAAAVGVVLAVAVMLLWNWLMPTLFGLPTIGYWQALGLFLLCHLLFKSHGHGVDRRSNGHTRRFASRVHGLVHAEPPADPADA